MTTPNLVLGLLDTSSEIGDQNASDRFRGFTIAWSRYGYQGELIEHESVDEILRRAAETTARYCFIQPYGFVLYERWRLEDGQPRDFFDALADWIQSNRFLAAGILADSQDAWYGFAPHCLLIELDEYRRLGKPAFDATTSRFEDLPQAEPIYENGRLVKLAPTGSTAPGEPRLRGWNLISAGLNGGLPVMSLSDDVLRHTLDLGATCPAQREAIAPLFGAGISDYAHGPNVNQLSSDQCRFLDVIKTQTENARRGVFLWNIESYKDIESPSDGFESPVSSLYSVAAGFKPNRILHSHGFADHTRVVFFDYSQPALNIRRYIIEEWDGDDFPKFLERIIQRFPYPETYYQLWNEVTPDDDIWDDVQRVWEHELSMWGGAEAFAEHWRRYRQLDHHYVCCNILTDPAPVLDDVRAEPNSIIWWSNAFFTMYGNWFYTIQERKRSYDDWIEKLANRNTNLFLIGSDHNNACVNSIRAGEYWERYRQVGGDCLRPDKLHRTEIRM